jgi:hypothetical protein
MKVGTKSLLFGSHQFILHPLMVALGWRHCYGTFPRDWRVWVVFLVHDWGYWGLDGMDTPAGQLHPARGANIVWRLFDRRTPHLGPSPPGGRGTWWTFSAYHSRYYARHMGQEPSLLMRADKMATALLPRWLLWLLATLSGEGPEYVAYHTAAGYPVRDVWDWAGALRRLWREQYGRAS